MKPWKRTLLGLAILAMAVAVNSVSVAAVAVGSSTLIKTLDYSDTFTQFGTVFDGRFDGSVIVGNGLDVENTYGNPASTWGDSLGYSYTHTTAPGCTNIPAPIPDSGAGSDTGIVVHNANPYPDYGFAYGLRDKFVVQYDAIQTQDRVDIGIGPVQANGQLAIIEDGTLWAFFRTNDKVRQIGVYNGTPNREYNTGLTHDMENYGEWHNYAVYFDLVDGEDDEAGRFLAFYIDEEYCGYVNIDTFADGVLEGIELSNAFVAVGYANGNNGDAHYFDNVQVGEPSVVIPPPSEVPGDTNNDGYVDATDAENLAANWGATVTAGDVTKGDFNGDGVVNAADASILAANWTGPATENAAGTVPEPSTMVLVLVSLLMLPSLPRRRG